MSHPIKKTTKEILSINQKRDSPLKSDFILWAHNIRSLHNVGALFRSSDSFGISELLLSGFTPVPPRPEISKTALGAEEYVPWRFIHSCQNESKKLKNTGYTIFGLEQTHTSELLTEMKVYTNKNCLILGNEVTGLDDNLLPLIDRFVEIPQFGEKHSLNVSVAAGIALYAFLSKLI
ncbi:MAG: TrmH family RNA methyltransferase [Balneolaceae bacterium]